MKRREQTSSSLGKTVADRPVEHLPLRELLTDADRLTRDLIDHMKRGFIPKVKQLNDFVKVDFYANDEKRIHDVTVRNQSSQLLDSEDFSKQLSDKLNRYVTAIDAAVEKIIEI